MLYEEIRYVGNVNHYFIILLNHSSFILVFEKCLKKNYEPVALALSSEKCIVLLYEKTNAT